MAAPEGGWNSGCIVITGATAGVGRAVAELYARRGWRIGLVARGTGRLEEARQALEALGAERTASFSADVAEAGEVERAAETFERELGPIDVWINSAMVTVYAPFDAIEPGEFERVTRVVYTGAVNGTRAALRRMRARGRGRIVCVGSALAYRAIPLQSAYCGAKFALRGFIEALRCELEHDEVPVTLSMVQLPGVNTPQFDWGRNKLPYRPRPAGAPYQPEVAARYVAQAADEGTREIFVGHSVLEVLAGNMAMPGLLTRLLASSGYSGQQTDEPADPSRPDNLFGPAPHPSTAHGRFDDEAHDRAVALTGGQARLAIFGGGALLAACIGWLLRGVAETRGRQLGR